MNTRRRWLLLIGLFPVSFWLLRPATVWAQELVAKEALDEWFYSRLVWGLLIGVVAGIFVGLVHLCRLEFGFKGALNVNNRARRKLLLWVAVVFLIGATLLFLDAWLLYPFGTNSLSFWDALTQVWSNYRMLLVLFVTLVVFVLLVAIATRFKSDCRCRYAFIPGPQRK
jgi:H+/Cl- antiporter ClcA